MIGITYSQDGCTINGEPAARRDGYALEFEAMTDKEG